MKSFEPGVFDRQAFPGSLLRVVRLLGECRVRLAQTEHRRRRALDRMREAAILGSVESSCRLEGVTVKPDRLRAIVIGHADAENRAEQELAGCRDALAGIAVHSRGGELTSAVVLRVHADLFRFTPGGGGGWKVADDLVTETHADGSSAVVFTPVPAYAVEDAMKRLHDGLALHWRAGLIDPLLLVPAYLLDFSCIHPFSEGTDRMVRLLARLLIERAGYGVGAFIPLDSLFERSEAAWSAALKASWNGWHRGAHDLAPWTEYFLAVLLEAYEQVERQIDVAAPPRGAKRDRVAEAVGRLPREFRYTDLERSVPSISRPTINRALRRLRAARVVRCVKPGRHARWERL